MSELQNQECPFCGEKKCTLRDEELEIPFFGKVFVFSLDCAGCGARKSDVEPAERKEPCKYTLELESEDDLTIKVVKSGEATLKIPHVITIESGPASEGYVTNVEGVLERVKAAIQSSLDSEEDDGAKDKARNLIKKLNRALVGREKLKIILEDPSGNSAIISDKAQKSKL
ncbi:ZPR1 zinc finger domain-containing protein [Candidatus Woesearchaeota archaeon]|nr:ZPR1 zinc finger domain-containing protein [Candidatus Woesearchaeota archaeon]